MKLAILGAGAWGTALAVALSARHDVALWARDPAQAGELASTRRNARYLPDALLPPAVHVTADPGSALAGAALALIATPTGALRGTLARLRALRPEVPVIWACKGFEPQSGLLPHQVLAELAGSDVPGGALSGPSFAAEVAQGRPTALTLASLDAGFARAQARALHQPRLRVYFNADLVGVEVGGAVKNVLAIATGICDGMALGQNARAALITRGLAEMTRFGTALGGRAETFMGLAGAGDLILTCTGELSRNREVGRMLAQGQPLEAVLERIGHVAEGVHSAREVERIAAAKGVDMPIARAVCDVLFRGMRPADVVQQLLSRDPRAEG